MQALTLPYKYVEKLYISHVPAFSHVQFPYVAITMPYMHIRNVHVEQSLCPISLACNMHL